MRMNRTLRWGVAVVLLAAGFVLGYMVSSSSAPRSSAADEARVHTETQKVQKWYCSMHPQIVRYQPGLCPICEMELIPMPENLAADSASRELVVSEAAARLMDVQTSPVERRFVANEVRMVGKVVYDETRVKHITAWVGGRLDRLYVDFTGTTVRKGDHLVYLYSPELISAQAELLQSVKASKNAAEATSDYLARSVASTLQASREKLRLLGLTPQQIEQIERSGEPLTHVTIYSPIGGVVIEKKANEGMYVNTGTQIYTVADLSQVWVKLDAYESDLPWIRYGQEVQFVAEAYPGRTFTGRVSFIDPVLDPMTRTVKVRGDEPNADGRLKPEMFVHAVVNSQIARDGKVMDPDLAGKWICPMHPSVVKSEAGTCDICGMDLVTTESLGYVAADAPAQPPLVIPTTAPLITGKRAVVYVKKPDTEVPTFEGREIVLGSRAGDHYVVESGLNEGEQVVTNGNFKIDSALQIQAKPSMMNPEGGTMPPGHQHAGHTPAQHAAATPAAATPATQQQTCPVLGGPIDPNIFVEYKGKKVFFCCKGCDQKFQEDPEKYLDKLPQFQESQQGPQAGTSDAGHNH
jgi:Cu(I)/Ag(I) efflux system membrane fusion protein